MNIYVKNVTTGIFTEARSMPPKMYRKQCPYCCKSFFTYEEDKEYCNSECESYKKYYDEFPHKKPLFKGSQGTCKVCGLACSAKSQYCSHPCKLLDQRIPEVEKKKNGGNRKGLLPFDVLNKIAEKKRVFDDEHAERMVRFGGMSDKI